MSKKAYECKSSEDIYNYLEHNLIPLYEYIEETIHDNIWIIKYTCKQVYCYNIVFYNKLTNAYAFHIIDEDDYNYEHEYKYYDFPNMGKYLTYAELLEGVSGKFCKLWKLNV